MNVGEPQRFERGDFPTVSVVMGTFNGAEYIGEQLASLNAQTTQPIELIICDDQSTDNTISIVESFASVAKFPVRIINNEHRLGFRENFLFAASLATSDIVAFCDQDDVWLPNKIERCLDYFVDHAVVLVVHQAKLIDGQGEYIGEFTQGITKTVIKSPLSYDPWSTFWGFSMVFRRSLLGVVNPSARFIDYIQPDHLIAHDRWICFLSQIFGKTAEIAEPLALYRQHGKNLFGSANVARKPSLLERSRTYSKATQQMSIIVNGLPPETSNLFPCFDKHSVVRFIYRAQNHADYRLYIHKSPTKFIVFMRVMSGLIRGKYMSFVGRGVLFRSFVRDLYFIRDKADGL